MAHLLNKSPEEYAEEKARFIREIRHFHDARG